jgi:hypothetical protein
LKERDKAMSLESGEEDLKVRALILRCLFSGLIARRTREPGLDIDLLKAMLCRVLPLVMHDDQENV